ncbi:hypothetical protein HQ590_12930 [bacterium]|nr:hypothetical protein [bacterium]
MYHQPPKQEYRWHIITNQTEFAPRDGAGALVFKDKMWLLGGWNPWDPLSFPRTCNNEVWSSTNGKKWKLEVLQAPWEGRHCAGYVVHQDKMWIVGGDCSHGHYQEDVWSSVDGVNWDRVCESAPWGLRTLHHTLAFQDKIWVMGGQTSPAHAPSEEVFYSDVWNSSDGKTWERVTANAPWGPRGMIGGSVVFNDRMWILGGGTSDTPTRPRREAHNDVWSSADGIEWIQQSDAAPWHPRQYHDVAVYDNKMWVLEGYILEGYNLNDAWYSSDGVEWAEVLYTPWAARHAASVFVYQDALWMVAGNNMTADVWKLMREGEVFEP